MSRDRVLGYADYEEGGERVRIRVRGTHRFLADAFLAVLGRRPFEQEQPVTAPEFNARAIAAVVVLDKLGSEEPMTDDEMVTLLKREPRPVILRTDGTQTSGAIVVPAQLPVPFVGGSLQPVYVVCVPALEAGHYAQLLARCSIEVRRPAAAHK